jgi:hypothetical protein
MAMCANPAVEITLISWIIAELIDGRYIAYRTKRNRRVTYVRTVFPAPAVNIEHADLLARARKKGARECTFSVDPQQRTGLFPLLEDITFDEPHTGSLVMSIAGGIEIYGRVRR